MSCSAPPSALCSTACAPTTTRCTRRPRRNFAEAERALQEALKTGLASAKDRANAHKHLAFVYCTSQRAPACEAAFREARHADPDFTLSRAETGHPQWGPVYKKVALAR